MLLKKQINETVIKSLYKSSNIVASIYEVDTQNLTVLFSNGGQYTYMGVPISEYQKFEEAESQGKVLNSSIKRYPFSKLPLADVTPLLGEVTQLTKPIK